MNLTFSSFLLHDLYSRSPIFQIPIQYLSKQTFQLKHSYFSNSFPSIFYSSSPVLFSAHLSEFKHILSSALFFDNKKFSNELLNSKRFTFIIEPVSISFCVFRLCFGQNQDLASDQCNINTNEVLKGGAIFCLTNLSLNQCLFEHNSACRGGSVYCTGQLSITSVTFDGGISYEGQGFVNENCPLMELTTDLVTFVNLEAEKHSCFIRSSPGNIVISASNFSTCFAQKDNAGFTLYDSPNVIIKISVIFELSSFTDTSIVMKKCGNTDIAYNLFWYLKSHPIASYGSTCISFYDTNSLCTVKRCSFLLCSPGKSQLVRTNGEARMMISELCSTVDRNGVIGNEKESGNAIVFDGNSRFNEACQDRYVIHVDKTIGFHTSNSAIDLATQKAEVYEGIFIGMIFLLIITGSAIITFALLYHITRIFI